MNKIDIYEAPDMSGPFEAMAKVACDLALQVERVSKAPLRDLCDIAAHILTIAVDASGSKAGDPRFAIRRFRETFRKAIEHEKLPASYLAAIGEAVAP